MFKKIRFRNKNIKKFVNLRIGNKWKFYVKQIYDEVMDGTFKTVTMLILQKFPRLSSQAISKIIIIKHTLIFDVIRDGVRE